jgi:hypothetical protein
LPYGDVIRRAQWMDRPALLGETFGTSKLDVDIAWALVAERRRRATIIHNAIHTGDAP